MQSIVQDAMKFSEKEKEYRNNSSLDDEFDEFGQPRIMIIGCGGAGNNTVTGSII